MENSRKPLVAIILVNYNGYTDTVECVKSIRESTYPAYRIIVVDNGSGDAERLQQDAFLNEHTTLILSEENLGFSGGNNLGIEYAETAFAPEYYFLLNNDTVIEPQALERMVDTCENTADCGILTGRILYYSEPKLLWAAGGKFDFRTGIADQPALGQPDSAAYDGVEETTFCTGCAMLIPARVLKTVGHLEESYFLYAEDTDYCCRVMNAGFKLYYTGEAVIYHKVSASTGRTSDLSQYYNIRNNFYIIQKYCTRPLLGYGKRWYRILRSLLRKELTLGNVVRGYRDFKRGIVGKVDL